MYIKKILFLLFALCLAQAHHDSQTEHDFIHLFQGCRKQLQQWVGFKQTQQQLIEKCKLKPKEQLILKLYKQMTELGLDFSLKHFDLIRKYLKEDAQFTQSFGCLIRSRNTQNQYFNEKKKFKYFGKFVRQHPKQGKFLFVQQQKMWTQKGKKICNYFKAFFQYYYLNVLKPSQTLSTTFLRSLTVRTDIFDHEDIAYCVDLETHGTLAQNLEGLDINNIYTRIPQTFNAIKYIKFKKDCKSEKYTNMMRKIQSRLQKIDMFKIMYHDYQPFVQVAAQKFGTSQLKLLARKFAEIIQNAQKYSKFSQMDIKDL